MCKRYWVCLAAAGTFLAALGQAKSAEFVCWKPSGAPIANDAAMSEKADTRHSIGDVGPMDTLTPVTAEQLLIAPYKYVGRLEFQQGGKTFQGTAEFIGSNILITAAHNVIDDTDGVASSISFFRVSTIDQPHSNRFDVEIGAYLTEWQDNLKTGPARYDYAILKTKISFAEGYPALVPGNVFSKDKPLDIIAYSWLSDTDKKQRMYEKAMVLKSDANDSYEADPATSGSGRAFTQGASGGAWLTDHKNLFSVEAEGSGVSENGPVFGSKVKAMVDFVKNGCKS